MLGFELTGFLSFIVLLHVCFNIELFVLCRFSWLINYKK
uniref:Uncharacterized protein n=1 Tax=Anguilla anguilla TaxID=7936 RepID=A0A0E9TBY9_ANGAN